MMMPLRTMIPISAVTPKMAVMLKSTPCIHTQKAVPNTQSVMLPKMSKAMLILRKCAKRMKKIITMAIIRPPMICGIHSSVFSCSPAYVTVTPGENGKSFSSS